MPICWVHGSGRAGSAQSRLENGRIGACVDTENWFEERDRLVRLLDAIEAGGITHIDVEGLRQLQLTNEENIAALKARLAELNTRLGPDDQH